MKRCALAIALAASFVAGASFTLGVTNEIRKRDARELEHALIESERASELAGHAAFSLDSCTRVLESWAERINELPPCIATVK